MSPASPWCVRPARPADVPAIVSMKQAWAFEDGSFDLFTADQDEWSHQMFGATPRFHALLAHDGDVVAAMLLYRERSVPGWLNSVISVLDLYTKPAYRRTYAARSLMAEVTRIAVRASAPLIELTVHRENPARKFYERLGFEHVHEALTYMVAGPAINILAADAPQSERGPAIA
jgi:ribosomal protein S18 acetylase RimI-like enzyme